MANEPDGSVRCVAEGPREDLEAFILELARGPLNARVDRVVPRWELPVRWARGVRHPLRGHSGD